MTIHPNKRLWRTLIRFESVDPSLRVAFAIIPAFDVRKVIAIGINGMPKSIWDRLNDRVEFPYRCHARVNIGADHHLELCFTDWEID